jgi:hypothetical protein
MSPWVTWYPFLSFVFLFAVLAWTAPSARKDRK